MAVNILFESDTDATGGVELAVNTYATLQDFLDGNTLSSQFSALNVTSPYSTTGITYDGTAYRVLFESDADVTSGVELAVNTYATLQDLLDGNTLSSQFSALNVTSPYSTTGFAYDGSAYRVLFESDADATGGAELAVNTYATLQDLLDGNTLSSQFSALNVTSPYSTTGLNFDGVFPPPPNGDDPAPIGIAEPHAVAVFGSGFIAIAFVRRCKRRPVTTIPSA